MSDTTDEMEALSGQYENFIERQEEREEQRNNENILIRKISRTIKLSQFVCSCNEGIHNGNEHDCSCKCHVV